MKLNDLTLENTTHLYDKCDKWDFTQENEFDPVELEKYMLALMKKENGIGLSANQIGLKRRVFTIKESKGPAYALFNPKILYLGPNKTYTLEGCLSFKDHFVNVKRSDRVMVNFFTSKRKSITKYYSGIDAKCFLHELDHLNGITFLRYEHNGDNTKTGQKTV